MGGGVGGRGEEVTGCELVEMLVDGLGLVFEGSELLEEVFGVAALGEGFFELLVEFGGLLVVFGELAGEFLFVQLE